MEVLKARLGFKLCKQNYVEEYGLPARLIMPRTTTTVTQSHNVAVIVLQA
jgi:hypothetical protein